MEEEVLVAMRLVTVVVPKEAVEVPVIAPPKNPVPEIYELPWTDSNEEGEDVPNPKRLAELSQIKLASPPSTPLLLN